MLLANAWFAASAMCLFAQGAGGIRRLTLETRDEAIRCGETGLACAIEPYRLCAPEKYTAWIASPFSRVALSVAESLGRQDRPRPITPGAANGWGVGVYVSPAADFDSAESIKRVVIQRGSSTIEPETATLSPVTVENATGEKKQLLKGFFGFSLEAFAPTADITIVLIGSTGEVRCRLDQEKLSSLR